MRPARPVIISTLLAILLLAGVLPATASSAHVADPALYDALRGEAPRLSPDVLRRTLDAVACAQNRGLAKRDDVLTVIDYSLPSTEPRLWVFDLERDELLWKELVAHGKNTGGNVATAFSNVEGSKQSSLGLFRTGTTYYGGNGYSLRLHGLEPGINDRALERFIVMHGADYVSDDFIRRVGRLGRSWGCPALSQTVARNVIDRIKGGSLVYAYYPDREVLEGSRFRTAAADCGSTSSPQMVAAAK